MAEETFDGWARLELMGHRTLMGKVRTGSLAGIPMLRIDVPLTSDDEAEFRTQYYAPSALYCLTPSTEEEVREYLAEAEAQRERWTTPVLEAGDDAGHLGLDSLSPF